MIFQEFEFDMLAEEMLLKQKKVFDHNVWLKLHLGAK